MYRYFVKFFFEFFTSTLFLLIYFKIFLVFYQKIANLNFCLKSSIFCDKFFSKFSLLAFFKIYFQFCFIPISFIILLFFSFTVPKTRRYFIRKICKLNFCFKFPFLPSFSEIFQIFFFHFVFFNSFYSKFYQKN